MKILSTSLEEVLVIEPRVHRDARGFLLETYHAARYREAGLGVTFVQDNHSCSHQGTLRGLHAQLTRPQGKLVRVIEGEVFDVAVDIRVGSPSFCAWAAERLSAENFLQLYIPPGFAHGFCVLSPRAQLEYKCTDFYDPGGEITIRWDDPEIGIEWPISEPRLSERDRDAPPLREVLASLPRHPRDVR